MVYIIRARRGVEARERERESARDDLYTRSRRCEAFSSDEWRALDFWVGGRRSCLGSEVYSCGRSLFLLFLLPRIGVDSVILKMEHMWVFKWIIGRLYKQLI